MKSVALHLLGQVGYGLPIERRFVGAAHAGVRTSEYGRGFQLGYAVQVLKHDSPDLQRGIDAERLQRPVLGPDEVAGANQRVIGHASLGW